MGKAFYELCYDQYCREMDEAGSMSQKGSIMLLVIPALTTAMVAIGRIDLLCVALERVDIFLYHAACSAGAVSLAISLVYLFKCIIPHKYDSLHNMAAWSDWRTDYKKFMSEEHQPSEGEEQMDQVTLERLCERLNEAQPANAKINEGRRQALRKSVLWSAIASAAIALEGIMFLLLRIQGI